MEKILYAGCFALSPAILTQFTIVMCVAARNSEKFIKIPFWVSGHSRLVSIK